MVLTDRANGFRLKATPNGKGETMKTAKTATAGAVSYTVPIEKLSALITAPALIKATATVDYITAKTVRVTFTARA